MRKHLVFVMCVALSAVTLGACDSNKGGATSCASFQGMDSAQRDAVVEKMIKDKGAGGPMNNLTLTKVSVSAYCLLHDGSATIDGIYHG
jgi:hypothetical protein